MLLLKEQDAFSVMCPMVLEVVAVPKHYEVVEPIIGAVVVNMMDGFVRSQAASDGLFDEKSMLQYGLTVNANLDIPIFADHASRNIHCMTTIAKCLPV